MRAGRIPANILAAGRIVVTTVLSAGSEGRAAKCDNERERDELMSAFRASGVVIRVCGSPTEPSCDTEATATAFVDDIIGFGIATSGIKNGDAHG